MWDPPKFCWAWPPLDPIQTSLSNSKKVGQLNKDWWCMCVSVSFNRFVACCLMSKYVVPTCCHLVMIWFCRISAFSGRYLIRNIFCGYLESSTTADWQSLSVVTSGDKSTERGTFCVCSSIVHAVTCKEYWAIILTAKVSGNSVVCQSVWTSSWTAASAAVTTIVWTEWTSK